MASLRPWAAPIPSPAPSGGRAGDLGSSYLPPRERQVIRVADAAIWSTAHLLAGTDLKDTHHELFTTAQGHKGPSGRTMTVTDTNVKQAGCLPGHVRFEIMQVSWQVLPITGETDMEQLANAFGRSAEQQIKDTGVLRWCFTQTWVDIGPLWLDSVPQAVSIPGESHFHVRLEFGDLAPKLTLDHAVRVVLLGRMAHPIEAY